MRGATIHCRHINISVIISTHTPHARCDIVKNKLYAIQYRNFYSHTSCEVRPVGAGNTDNGNQHFYSHTSCEVRPRQRGKGRRLPDFYSHTSCEVRHRGEVLILCLPFISTHTPHARCDTSVFKPFFRLFHFYSHTSCEVRPVLDLTEVSISEFLLTHLMRGATPFSDHLQ